MISGKATLIRDDYCDGLGDCLPHCPTDAITFEEREAAPYDAQAVAEHKNSGSTGIGCPGSRMQTLHQEHTGCPGQKSQVLAGTDDAVPSVQPSLSRSANGRYKSNWYQPTHRILMMPASLLLLIARPMRTDASMKISLRITLLSLAVPNWTI